MVNSSLWTSLLPRYRRGQRGGSGRQILNRSHEQGGPYETCRIRATQVAALDLILISISVLHELEDSVSFFKLSFLFWDNYRFTQETVTERFPCTLCAVFPSGNMLQNHGTTRILTLEQHRPSFRVPQFYCTPLCVCLVLCSFILRVDLCVHYYTQGTELCHHDKTLFYNHLHSTLLSL